MDIDQVIGGYIVTEYDREEATQRIFVTLEELFTHLLFKFERRYLEAGDSSFGEVIIHRASKDLTK